jgi:uncharacterized SAM-binding protein YcdF (DUF218 family)
MSSSTPALTSDAPTTSSTGKDGGRHANERRCFSPEELASTDLMNAVRTIDLWLAVSILPKGISPIVKDAASIDVNSPTMQITEAIDVIVLCGSEVVRTVDLACSWLLKCPNAPIVITGGFGHSTPLLHDAVSGNREALQAMEGVNFWDRSESAIFRLLMLANGIEPERITIEEKSTNCGGNASESLKVILEKFPAAKNVLVIQDPSMTRRTYHTFRHHYLPHGLNVYCTTLHADPTYRRTFHIKERFLSLLLGEIPRLVDDENGYGPKGKGFLEHCDVPVEVLEAHKFLAAAYPHLVGR